MTDSLAEFATQVVTGNETVPNVFVEVPWLVKYAGSVKTCSSPVKYSLRPNIAIDASNSDFASGPVKLYPEEDAFRTVSLFASTRNERPGTAVPLVISAMVAL